MQFAIFAALFAAASAQVTISLPSGVTLLGVSLSPPANKRFHKRQGLGGSISGLSGISINLQQTRTNVAAATTTTTKA
ncbi:hypothetical protein NEMBOFW57_010961 [Staphylotrichum longicolle]|uniref:Uncharacterized protein n=1 Tax=Staphylotrichum longicolle TaxID=669026 RepID=A0AAD4HXJ0_9PEZI|nr:hypothetical protein NEMBOFW57_010961 [Staphylotrichum longicolle]